MHLTSTPSQGDNALIRVNAPQPFFSGFGAAVGDIWRFRELLVNLVRKELRVRYKESVLGFLWSLARPIFLLTVYHVVFSTFLRTGVPNFVFYLFAGLIAWDLFASTLNAAAISIVGNPGLIKKVYFPREVLPLATVGAGLVHFVLQLGVLAGWLIIAGYDFVGAQLLLLPVAFVGLVLLMTAFGLLLAAANVYLRDTQHLTEVSLLLWFWLTPIVYPINLALDGLRERSILGVDLATIYLFNPITNVVMGFQRAIYKHVSVVNSSGETQAVLYPASLAEYYRRLGLTILAGLVLVWFAQRVFARVQGNFAQEL